MPQLSTIVAFCLELESMAEQDPLFTFAIHCRGGKGRTGLMVCSWLLWSGVCKTAGACRVMPATSKPPDTEA